MNQELIVFDLNGTLIENNSWLDLNLAMGITQEEDDHLMARAAAGEITDYEGQQWLLNTYRERGDVSRENIMKILTNFTYRPHVREVVAELKERGYAVAIISGAMDILVQHVAQDLEINHWKATNIFKFDDTDSLIGIEAANDEGAGKLASLHNLTRELNINLQSCFVIGDGSSDIPLFQATTNGITFSNSKIVNEAKYIIDTLDDILQIVNPA